MSKRETDVNQFINSLDLVSRLYSDVPSDEQPEFQDVIKQVQKLISVTENKKGLLVVTAKASFAQLASNLANAYIQHLQRYLLNNTSTESPRNRVFIEKQHKWRQQLFVSFF